MKTQRMKRRTPLILFQLAVLVGLWGCAQYQYVTVDGKLMYDDNYRFFDSNDTLTVLYTFNGLNCPVNIELHNNHTKPVYVDWSRSFAVIDGKAYSYFVDDSRLNAMVETYHYDYNYLSPKISSVQGIISKNDRVRFLPPKSYITATPIWLRSNFFNLSNSSNLRDTAGSSTEGKPRGKRYYFNETESPMAFRSFLTVSFTEDFSDPIYLDHSFWASEIVEVKFPFFELSGMSGNQFYLEREREGESISMYAALIAIPLIVSPFFL